MLYLVDEILGYLNHCERTTSVLFRYILARYRIVLLPVYLSIQ